jgi:hypothetical protein
MESTTWKVGDIFRRKDLYNYYTDFDVEIIDGVRYVKDLSTGRAAVFTVTKVREGEKRLGCRAGSILMELCEKL